MDRFSQDHDPLRDAAEPTDIPVKVASLADEAASGGWGGNNKATGDVEDTTVSGTR